MTYNPDTSVKKKCWKNMKASVLPVNGGQVLCFAIRLKRNA